MCMFLRQLRSITTIVYVSYLVVNVVADSATQLPSTTAIIVIICNLILKCNTSKIIVLFQSALNDPYKSVLLITAPEQFYHFEESIQKVSKRTFLSVSLNRKSLLLTN
jgi:hypothetical protein